MDTPVTQANPKRLSPTLVTNPKAIRVMLADPSLNDEAPLIGTQWDHESTIMWLATVTDWRSLMRSMLSRVPPGRQLARAIGLILGPRQGIQQKDARNAPRKEPTTAIDPFSIPSRDRMVPISCSADLESYLTVTYHPADTGVPPPTIVGFLDGAKEPQGSPQFPVLSITSSEAEVLSMPKGCTSVDMPLPIPSTRLRPGIPKCAETFQKRILEVEKKIFEYRRLRWHLIRKARVRLGKRKWRPTASSLGDDVDFLRPNGDENDLPDLTFPEDKMPSSGNHNTTTIGFTAVNAQNGGDQEEDHEDPDEELDLDELLGGCGGEDVGA